MTAEVVQLPVANLADIPSMLRNLADQIDAGEWGKVGTVFMVMPQHNDFPRLFGWGDITGLNEPIVQIELLKHWLITNLVSR